MFILSKHCGSVIFHPLHVTILVATLWGFVTLPLLGLLSWCLAMLPPLWCLTQLRFVILTLVGLAPAFFCNLDFWGLFLGELECWDFFCVSDFRRGWSLAANSDKKQLSWGQLWANYINNFFSQFWLILWHVLDESLFQSKVMGILKRPLCLMATMRSG